MEGLGKCKNKTRYINKQRAKNASSLRKRETGVKCSVYECKECGGYHLTSMTQAAYRALNKS